MNHCIGCIVLSKSKKVAQDVFPPVIMMENGNVTMAFTDVGGQFRHGPGNGAGGPVARWANLGLPYLVDGWVNGD